MDGEIELKEYLEKKVDSSKHELIRRHVFTATRNYHHRVKAFIHDIVTDKNNPMQVEYWSTKVEFQGRGTAHNHGVIWVDMKKMELINIDDDGKWINIDHVLELPTSEALKIKVGIKRLLQLHYNEENGIQGEDFVALEKISDKIFQSDVQQTEKSQNNITNKFVKRFPLFGITTAFKKFQSREKLLEYEEKAVIAFANKFTTCTLNEAVIAAKTDDEVLKRKANDVAQILK